MSGATAEGTLATVLEREDAALEVRHWVRLTRLCNNRCMFCHDAERQDGSVVPLESVRADILAGRRRGATRLVLSGGEPTIHPDVVSAIEEGRRAGYTWIQLISNGRMFAYDRFTKRAVAAGLDEATISAHGHTPELHDALVGIRGAFSQTVRGIRNLQSAGRVVSVDVVVTRPNVRHLADILRCFLALGVREFDLLHLVPFGRAFDAHRDELFFDGIAERQHVLEALRLAELPGVHLWTNRWPAPLLEGAEHLIQDPHKILDEVRGTSEGFEEYLTSGVLPWCRGERCPHCFLEPFCLSLLEARERLVAGSYLVVEIDPVSAARLGERGRAVIARQSRAAFRIRAREGGSAAEALRVLSCGEAAGLELDLELLDDIPAALASRTLRVTARREADLDAAMALRGADLEVPLSRETLGLARRAAAAAPDRTVLTLPGRERLSEVLALDPAPGALAGIASEIRAEALPACIAPRSSAARAVLDARTLRPDGSLDLLAWAERWVERDFRTRSLRCSSCADANRCPGAHVNYVRAFGFGWMRPRAAAGG